MKKNTFILIKINIILSLLLLSCGYQVQKNNRIKNSNQVNIQYIILCGYEPFYQITKSMEYEFFINKIFIIKNDKNKIDEKNQKFPILEIINVSENQIINTLFQNGKIVEYQLVLQIKAKLLTLNKKIFPIDVQVSHEFLVNPAISLFNDLQEKEIKKIMYQEVSQKILNFLLKNIN